MAEKTFNVRMVATGGGQLRSELLEVGATGDAAFGKVRASADSASVGLKKVGDAAKTAGQASAGLGGGMRQTMQQLSQVAQSGAATGNWVQSLAIQLPDLALAFGPVGIAAGAVAGVLVTMAPSLLGAGNAAKEYKDRLKEASDASKALKDAVTAATIPFADLKKALGDSADEMARLNRNQLEAARGAAAQKLQDVVKGLGLSQGSFERTAQGPNQPGMFDWLTAGRTVVEAQSNYEATVASLVAKFGLLTPAADKVARALDQVAGAKTPDDAIVAADKLQSVLIEVAGSAEKAAQRFPDLWSGSADAAKLAQENVESLKKATEGLIGSFDRGLSRLQQIKQGLGSAQAFDNFTVLNQQLLGMGAPYGAEMDRAAVGGDAISLIKKFEGYRSTPYWDVNAYRAGFGSDTVTLSDGSVRAITQGMSVSLEDANRDLSRRVGEFQAGIIAKIGVERWNQFGQGQKASLTSIAYNYGSLPNRIVGAVRGGTNQDIATAIGGLAGDNNGVNRDRRLQEAQAFGDTVYITRQLALDKQRNDELQRGLGLRADFIASLKDQADAARLEAETTGQSVYEQVRLRTELSLTQQARAKGIELTEKIAGSERTYGQAISETADSMARAAQEQAMREEQSDAAIKAAEKSAAAMKKIQDDLKQGFHNAFDSVVRGTQSVSEAIRNMLADIALQFAHSQLDKLLSGLLGAAFGSVGGGFGKALGNDALAAALDAAVMPSFSANPLAGDARMAQQEVKVMVGIDPNNGNVTGYVDKRASAISSRQMAAADRQMPSRVQQISRDPLRV